MSRETGPSGPPEQRTHSRHTVPNTAYPSFPCFQEEIQLKTNVIDCDSNQSSDANQDKFEVNVSMHDKLKMCFAEMQDIKDRFDSRRRRLQPKKKTVLQSSNATQFDRRETPTFLVSKESGGNTRIPSVASTAENRFKAHLIRTSSKDSLDNGDETDREVPQSVENVTQTPFYPHSSQQSRRSISDPFKGDEVKHRKAPYDLEANLSAIYGGDNTRPPTNWSSASTQTRTPDFAIDSMDTHTGFNQWLQKLDEINNISRSTISRIKKLENDLTNLKETTDNLSPKPKKTPLSKIPITSSMEFNRMNKYNLKKTSDKSINTDIDMNLMDKLLNALKSVKQTSEPGSRTEGNERRRLTTTISRSVEIQTELERPKLVEEKGISTDDTLSSVPSMKPSEISILDLPNIETVGSELNGKHSKLPSGVSAMPTTNVITITSKTPEPIVEMYSDSDETSFDDFERNIFNEISRRALITNRITNRKSKRISPRASFFNKYQNSSTQTNEEGKDKEANNSETENKQKPVFKKNMFSTSKIIIERSRQNHKEKSEIILKTNIDRDGKVNRTTEVTNSKYNPKLEKTKGKHEQSDVAQESRLSSRASTRNKKINSDQIDAYHSKNYFPRTLSAFDLTQADMVPKSNEEFISNKAFSSLDISSKSPVISEGYYSEQLDNQRASTPAETSEYLIEPPDLYRGHYDDYLPETKPKVTNKVVREVLEPMKDSKLGQNNMLTLTNETLIENKGKQTNITTKSSTIRKYNKPKNLYHSKSNFDLSTSEIPSRPMSHQEGDELNRSQSVSQCNIDQLQPVKPERYNAIRNYQNQSAIPYGEAFFQPNCNFSFMCNYGTDVVFSLYDGDHKARGQVKAAQNQAKRYS